MKRTLIIGTLALLMIASAPLTADAQEAGDGETKKIAIVANYFAARSHGNAIATRFFIGFPTDDGLVPPQVEVVSLWIDQPAPREIDYDTRGHWDVGERLAEMHGATVYSTIAEALTLGGDELAVDGVLYIGEHGDYPRSRLGVKMYPRLNHMEQIFRVFDASGRSVPVFCDKHLAYSWLDSRWIYDRARELDVPMMAGSVLPVAWRDPPLEHPIGARITEAVAVGHGALDSYGFHILEILQCMIERRDGGETGVESVRAIQGQAVFDALDAGEISLDVVQAACDAIQNKRGDSLEDESNPTAIIINYNDGTRGAILMLPRYIGGTWAYAANVDGEIVASEFVLQQQVSTHFAWLGLNIEKMFLTGEPQTPVERTLLTSGILDMAVRSLEADGELIETPFLDIEYSAEGYDPIRPTRARPEPPVVRDSAPEGYDFLMWRRELLEDE